MSAKLRAAQVLSLLLLARADFGGYSSAGSLNGVAIVAPNAWLTTAQLAYEGSNVATAYVTNGTGNWYYPQYASPYLNGASKGQGDVTYPPVNTDFAGVAAYTGTFSSLDIYWDQDGNSAFTPAQRAANYYVGVPDAPAVASPVTTGTYYSAAAGSGITKVTFASKRTGIAVGLGPSVAAGDTSQPTILITKDGGASWQQVSGVPSYVLTDAQTEYDAGPPTLYPMPPTGAPDLFGVYFASKSLGWAVGGNAAYVQFSNSVPIGGITPAPLATNPGNVNSGTNWGFAAAPDWGYGSAGVLMTTNGGTVWRNVPVVYDQVSLYAAYSTDVTVGQQMLSSLQPGTLFAVHADSSGKNVYAVGANPWQLVDLTAAADMSAPADLITYGGTTATHTVSLRAYGTILYSANGGVSWTLQAAPAMLGTYNYALLDVYVAKSTTVFAVGGSLTNPTGAGQLLSSTPAYTQYTGPQFGNGIIIATENSGNTWYMQSFPRNEYGMAPAFTCITFNGPVGWVGGYVFDAGAVVVYDSTTATAATYDLTGQWYTGVGGQGATTFTGTVTYPVTGSDVEMGSIATSGLSYTVLITMDRKMWTVVPPHAFPVGFALAGDFSEDAGMIPAEAVALQPDVKGIVWDNSQSGWMYGIGVASDVTSGFILRTRNGGATWTYETPNDVVANSMHVISLANVPSSY